MATYAALVSLMNNVEQIKNHPGISTLFDDKQLESILERVDSLLVFVESNNSYGGGTKHEELERQIACAAHSAEDVIEFHIVDHILPQHMIRSPVVDQPALSNDEIIIQSLIRDHRRANAEQAIILDQIFQDMDQGVTCSIKDMIQSLIRCLMPANSTQDDMIQSPIRCLSPATSTQYMIQSPIVDQIVATSNIPVDMLDLREIIQDMDSIMEKVEEERGCKVELPPHVSSMAAAAASSRPHSSGKKNMVGFDDYFSQLLLKLTGHQPDRQVIPIVGMGGLGKTTLARNTYDSFPVVRHFTVRAWVVISQTYIFRDILCETLSCLGKSKHETDRKAEHELGVLLNKTLFNRRYLIIFDDMWSIEAWDRIKFFFPDNCNGSRILVTTRMSAVANHFGSKGLELKLLDDDQSWKLFCENVFPREDCPTEIEESGKKIVKKCKGLPLAIVVIGGVLRNSSRTQDNWESVENDVPSILIAANDNQCFNLLSLSYSHLPARLKPCFLYLGIFPEDSVIRVSRLIKLWVAEGFIKPNKDQSLEEIAECYIKDLVNRNLITVHGFRSSRNVKTFSIHDLLRDLCIRLAEKENFLCVTTELDTPQEMDRQRRVIIHGSIGEEMYLDTRVVDTLKPKSLPRSLIFSNGRQVHVKSRLLRVLAGVYSEPRDIIFQQVNMRFLAQEHSVWSSGGSTYELPSSISLLWNVQTLLMRGAAVHRVYAPSEIWNMTQLRHLKFNFLTLPYPPPDDRFILHNLQTLGKVVNFSFTKEACKRMPNIKKLSVYYGDFSRNGCNFVWFNKLESLHYEFDYKAERNDLLLWLKFPNSLKKLTLERCSLQWKELTVIGSLPHLEALILMVSSTGPNWDPVKGVFLRLRYLRIVSCDLVCWNADYTHFPVLENLVLEDLYHLNEIPSGVGDIHTLKQISVGYSTDSSALSAVKILEEQLNFGKKGLQVKVRFVDEEGANEFMELVEAEGLTGLNFLIEVGR